MSEPLLPLGVSIVLYRVPATTLQPLVSQLLEQGASRVYLLDNSPASFDCFRDWTPHARVATIGNGRNLGYGRANNVAIRQSVAHHRYHLVCNPDITLAETTLATLCCLMDTHPEIGLCMPRVVGLDGAVQHLCKRPPTPLDYLSAAIAPQGWGRRRRARLEMRDHSYEQEMEVECLSGCFMLFRSSVLAALGGFDERFFLYFEDFDLSRRAHRLGRNLYYPRTQIVHGYQRGHRRSMRLRLHFILSAVRYFNKWGWLG